jgi:hypothetical protein
VKSSVSSIFGFTPDFRTNKRTKALVDSESNIGIEVELENWRGSPAHSDKLAPHWQTHEDSSLRGPALEVKFSMPMKGKDIIDALTMLEKTINSFVEKPLASTRTSTHVHMDTGDVTREQLHKWLCLYIILERLIYRYVGNKREKSIFCVPFYKASGRIDTLGAFNDRGVKDHRLVGTLSEYFTGDNRYSGLNLNALYKFGTIEFRMLDGEYRKSKLIEWLNILLCIKKYAKDMPHDIDKLNIQISEQGTGVFLESIFGELSKKLTYDEDHIDIIKGVRLTQDILHPESDLWNILEIGKDVSLGKDLVTTFMSPPKHSIDLEDAATDFFKNMVNPAAPQPILWDDAVFGNDEDEEEDID